MKILKMVPRVSCTICKAEFKPHWCENYEGNFYCSRACLYESRRNRIPWNKGLKASEDERVKKFVEAGHRARRGKPGWAKGLTWGASAWLRKENPNKYRNIHKKIYKLYGDPNKCEGCSKKGNNRQIHWANKDGKYELIKKDWMRLCVKCHIAYDNSNKTRKDLGL